jgi:glycerophosphoryl diester phosphodiesterase
MTNNTTSTKAFVIAHRGACGYLPEHTLPAKALAYGMGADYLEQDIVASRDNELIVLHDIHLESVSDVVEKFPERAREDGRWYARDFDLAELKTLRVFERMTEDREQAVFPARFPYRSGRFRFSTLREEIELTQGMNRSTGRRVGIYPEIKSPAWHHEEGVDVARLLLDVLAGYGYQDKSDPVFVQCFDARELRRVREELGCKLNLVQLVAENSWGESDTDYDHLKTPAGLQEVAQYADGLGPWIGQLYTLAEIDGHPVSTGYVKLAHEAGMTVHPYTFRADQLGPGFESFAEMVQWFAETIKVDGMFTDFPDLAVAALAKTA